MYRGNISSRFSSLKRNVSSVLQVKWFLYQIKILTTHNKIEIASIFTDYLTFWVEHFQLSGVVELDLSPPVCLRVQHMLPVDSQTDPSSGADDLLHDLYREELKSSTVAWWSWCCELHSECWIGLFLRKTIIVIR